MIEVEFHENEEKSFGEFRRKVRGAEVLSAAMQRLLQTIRFNGRLSVIVQNGQVLKSGYEEGYFRQTGDGDNRQAAVAASLQTK
jgi:hypothetical protein